MTTSLLPVRPTCTIVPAASLRSWFDRLRADGVEAQTTVQLPPEPWDLRERRIACVTEIASTDEARDVLVALLRGADVVAAVDPSVPMSVVRDLGRVADLRHRDDPAPVTVELSADQLQILGLLAEGQSLPEVAATLYLSLRTAERRLSAARRLLGVRTTAEALLARSWARPAGASGGIWGPA